MMSSDRYVFETNVIVSALLFAKLKPRQAFNAALDRGTILISVPVAEELNKVLSRKKFDRYLLPEARKRFLESFFRQATAVEIVKRVQECRDPKDDKFLDLAVNSRATCIISGDKDLLDLYPFRGIPILTPNEFLSDMPQGE